MKKKKSPKVATRAKPSRDEIERKKMLAYTLYVENGFEQRVISEITGISENSISIWKKAGGWDRDKEEARMGFDQQRRRIRRQIDNVLTKIENRDEGENVPDSKETDIINKLADAARKLQTELSYAHKVEAGKQFVQYVLQTYGKDKGVEVVELWHQYLIGTT